MGLVKYFIHTDSQLFDNAFGNSNTSHWKLECKTCISWSELLQTCIHSFNHSLLYFPFSHSLLYFPFIYLQVQPREIVTTFSPITFQTPIICCSSSQWIYLFSCILQSRKCQKLVLGRWCRITHNTFATKS
jgi:hypothetical protein